MTIRGKILAAAAVPVMAAGVALTAGGPAHAAAHDVPLPIGYSITASNAYTDSISNVTATFGAPPVSLIGFPRLVQFTVPADTIQFGATDSLGYTITWSSTDIPTHSPVVPATDFTLSPTGVLTLPTTVVPSRVTFHVLATHGLAVAVATVTVTGVNPSSDLVSVTPDTVQLSAPVNANGLVLFPTVPSTGVTETLMGGPAGAVFSNGVLSAGAAIPGVYPHVAVTAMDAAGATAYESFDATVAPSYAPIPRLSNGHAVSAGPTRENVYFIQSGAPSWDHFIIVGPGAINGHQGWVYGTLGLNVAVYGGLQAYHGYTVFYQPVTGQGSTTPIPGSHTGYVFFVTH
jgi:hypothetical protein